MSKPPPKPADADFPGPPPSLDIPRSFASGRTPDKPESKFPEIDAAIRIVDVDTRPLDRRSTALNPWNVKTPGSGVEAAAALEALKDVRRSTAAIEPVGRRRLFLLLALATGAAVVTFAAIIAVALLKGPDVTEPPPVSETTAPVVLSPVTVVAAELDPATRVARRQAMVAAFDRHDFSQGIAIGEELEQAQALDPEAELWLADACRHTGQAALALRRYEEFIRAHPEHKLVDAAHLEAAEMARRDGKLELARQHYKAIVADEKSGLRSKAKKRLASLK